MKKGKLVVVVERERTREKLRDRTRKKNFIEDQRKRHLEYFTNYYQVSI